MAKHVFLILLFTFVASAGVAQSNTADSSRKNVTMISVEGSISPPTTNYINRGIREAKKANAECLLIQLDTPGGLLESTKSIVQSFLDSDDMPIVVYVAPEGGRAASAGTFITMASHVAVMAPTTTIGAASPVQMGGGQTDSVMQKKLFNYSESFIESIANRRNRNADWARSAVREGKAITAEKALELNVIDFIAPNRTDVLRKIDGRVVNGDTLNTRNATISKLPTNLAESLLSFIIRPEVMLILTMIAIYGIIGEVTNPGTIIPGVAGVIALILVLYASSAMPINIAGFALIGLAIVLFTAEAFTPAFGVLIAGGSVSFFLGALMLFQDLPESMELSWAWLIPATILTTLFFAWIVTEGVRVQFTSNQTGKESMIGKHAEVIEPVTAEGGTRFRQRGILECCQRKEYSRRKMVQSCFYRRTHNNS
ncbi:membrane-bound serine protease (ClpP class) [Fodinibius salinus]|uniref:Membrane-bound serine protease (ClpP class) n=1 Tax=Fodinibius salinus TaxID=860790 RepID=A0A5D3YIQ0_9BACT|nr:nodulation protein NfeD [Fodinibius salinus]TYP93663.1 membrane-bound serine protease (ClpP class) [Fodinibius salinus]